MRMTLILTGTIVHGNMSGHMGYERKRSDGNWIYNPLV